MSASQRMMTSPDKKPPLFDPPDLHIDERVLGVHLAKAINAENFSTLIASNYLMAMAAYDRKLGREYYEEVLVTTFNFQNRLVRIAEINTLIELLKEGKEGIITDLKAEVGRQMELAIGHQAKLIGTLALFKEMRMPEDSVS